MYLKQYIITNKLLIINQFLVSVVKLKRIEGMYDMKQFSNMVQY